MSEQPKTEPITIFACGPSTAQCVCECTRGGKCEHKWDGAPIEDDRTWTVTCSRCGMTAMSHSLWVSE